MTSSHLVALQWHGAVATITMNDPATLNAASLSMVEELAATLAQASMEARAIILTGEGRAFCSGANLAQFDFADPDYDAGAGLETHYSPLIEQIRQSPCPIVAAVNGAAAGFGCALTFACDFAVAGEGAFFLLPFRNIGLVADAGVAYLVQKAAGRMRASEMMLLGDRIPAAQALAWGLVNRVVAKEDLLTSASAVAERLANGPPMALSLMRRLGWLAGEISFEQMLALEREYQTQVGRTAEHREGVAAFLEKRQADFHRS